MKPRAPAPAGQTCARPDCTSAVTRAGRRGRPPIYCSPDCRARAKRRRATAPVLVEVDHAPLTSDRRPAGRVWLVRISRGPQAAIVATGLGRTTADNLAAQISAVLRPQSTSQGAAIN